MEQYFKAFYLTSEPLPSSILVAILSLKSPVCPILRRVVGTIVGFIPLSKILALCKMQTALVRI